MHRLEKLVSAVQRLSFARTLDDVARIVRTTARELTGADGASFVLRDRDLCFYADEDAIEPLWKGLRFPMSACVSGWVMLNKVATVIPDIYADPRVPTEAYRPTFVKSMAMVPIRQDAPLGAIGNYWARPHAPTPEDVHLLQALADSTSVALENVQLYDDLERRVVERTAQMKAALDDLESFSYSVSHDLRAPLRTVDGFTDILREEYPDVLDPRALEYIGHIRRAAGNMNELIESLLELSRIARVEVTRQSVDLGDMSREIASTLPTLGSRRPELEVGGDLVVEADPRLVRSMLGNLLENAWKYSARASTPKVEVGRHLNLVDPTFFVKDNGVGFDMAKAAKLFQPFTRLHTAFDFQGTGIGLATVHRIVGKHGGRVWADAAPGLGATFSFTLAPAA